MRWCMLLVLIELIHIHELGDTHSDVYSHLDCCMGVRLVMDGGWVNTAVAVALYTPPGIRYFVYTYTA